MKLTIQLDESIENTKRLANLSCRVGTHVIIVDHSGYVLEYTFITRESKESFKTKPNNGIICPIELMFKMRKSYNILYK